MKRVLLPAVAAVLLLSGCAGMGDKDYQHYAETQRQIANSRAMAETARYAALAEIAKSGDTTARVAAVMSLQMGGQTNQPQQQVQAPTPLSETLLRWAGVLVPSLTQIYGIQKNAEVAINQSNNNRDVQVNTNQTMLGMGALTQGVVTGTPGMQMLYPEPAANRVVIVPQGSTTVTAPAGIPATPAGNTTTINNTAP